MMSNGNGNFLASLFAGSQPRVGCEISSSAISFARWSAGGNLEAASLRPLPPGAVEPSPLRENLQNAQVVRNELALCMNSLGLHSSMIPAISGRPTDVALILPDQAARVFILDFDSLPKKPAEAIPLIQWRLRKSVPFEIETASVSYYAQHNPQGQWQVVAVVMPKPILQQYEEAAASLGMKARHVTLSSLAALGLLAESAGSVGSVLVAKYSPPSLTTLIVRNGLLCLFRTSALGDVATSSPDARQILDALYPSAAYFFDTFGTAPDAAILCGMGDQSARIAAALQSELNLPTRNLLEDSGAIASGWSHADTERYLSALMGVAREQLAA